MSLNPQVEDEKKKPDSIGTGIGKEIKKLKDAIEKERMTLIPLKLYFVKNKVKILIGVCRGKKNYDKRESLKEKDMKRNLEKRGKYEY